MRGEAREVWRERVKRWVASGETAEEFARMEGVSAQTLRHWKWRFGREVEGKRGGRSARFVEVVAPSPGERDGGEGFEVTLAGGMRVRVPSRFDERALRRLLSVLGT